jgi:uncharacterized surface protein with fasciclin (FAS1) repeats
MITDTSRQAIIQGAEKHEMKTVYAILAVLLVTSMSATATLAKPAPQPTILELALAANAEGSPYEGQFDILIAAVLAADPSIAERLNGRTRSTVFAPTDDAFEAAFTELGLTAEQVLNDKQLLSTVLLYHVVPGTRDAESVIDSSRLRTLQGSFIMQSEGVLTDALGREANIIVTDLRASNGIIHVIDNVILPG